MTGASNPRKPRLFIFFSRPDLPFADQLARALELYDFEVLLDRDSTTGTKEWRKRLSEFVRDADTVIYVLSPDSPHLTHFC